MKIKYLTILPVIAVFALSGISLAHAQVFTDNLYYGIHDKSQVSQLQEFLTSQGLYSGPISGNFYFLTLSAVKAFQNQQGIVPAAGYFGSVTRAAANTIADAAVGASNNEAITETGTSTPPVQASSQVSSTPELQLSTLLQEVALLQQELTAQQSNTQALSNLQTQAQTQTQTLQQIQQNTQAIQQNTTLTPTAPTPSTPSTSPTITLGSIQLMGANNGTNQLYTSVKDTNLSIFLFDHNGNPITTASATIITDDPLSSGVGWGNNGETEINNSPSGQTTFSLAHANVSNPSSPVSMQHNNGYIFAYIPQTNGQHTITVSALGSTQSVTVTSQTPPSPPQPTVSLIPPQNGATYIGYPQTSAVVASLACQYPNPYGVYSYSYSPSPSSLTYVVSSTDFTASDLSLTTTGSGAGGSCVNITLNPLPSTGGTFQLNITGLQFMGSNGGSSTNALRLPITTAEFQVDAPNTITLWSNNTPGGGVTSEGGSVDSILNPYDQQVYSTRVYVGGHSSATLQISWTGSNPANNLAYFYVPCNSNGCNPAPAPIQTTSPNGGSFPITLISGYSYATIYIMTPSTIVNNVNGPQTYAPPSDSSLTATLLLQ